MPARKPKKKKPDEWKTHKPEDYQKLLPKLVHFSAKPINTNTPGYGIRLSANELIDLPYVAVSSMKDISKVPLDYEQGAQNKKTAAQILDVVSNNLDHYDNPPVNEIKAIRKVRQILEERYETPLPNVGIRLRQIIVQDESGENISLTPLHSAGFSKVLEERLADERGDNNRAKEEETTPPKKQRSRGFLGIGGSNPLNIGLHASSLQCPLWFKAPDKNMEIRRAFAIHYRGISLAIPSSILDEFYKWRQGKLVKHLGQMPADLKTRNKEKEYILRMVKAVTDRAANATELLVEHKGKLHGGELMSKSMPPLMRGLLEPGKRDRKWKREFSKKLHITIIDSKIQIGGEKVHLGIDQDKTLPWISIIEEAL